MLIRTSSTFSRLGGRSLRCRPNVNPQCVQLCSCPGSMLAVSYSIQHIINYTNSVDKNLNITIDKESVRMGRRLYSGSSSPSTTDPKDENSISPASEKETDVELPDHSQIVNHLVYANLLLDMLANAESNPKQLRMLKHRISGLVEAMAQTDIDFTTDILYHFLTRLPLEEVAALMRGALNQDQTALVLGRMAHFEDWRENRVMDLAVVLMKDFPISVMKTFFAHLPMVPISENLRDPETAKESDGPDDGEIDYKHPRAYWGYRDRVAESDRRERENPRMESRIIAPLGPDDSASMRTDEGNPEHRRGHASILVLLEIPYKSHGAEWLPDEIGAMIGRLLADEWELDYITLLLTDLATNIYAEDASRYRWEDYLGYMGIIMSSALGVQRHWENEDLVWVYKDFCIDVGRWALRTWPEFGEMEYREWLVDIVVQGANKRKGPAHDTKLISAILQELCEDWDYERSDYLGYMIEARMKSRSEPYRTWDRFLSATGLSKLPLLTEAQGNRSLLWNPPPRYYDPKEWHKENERRLALSANKDSDPLSIQSPDIKDS